MFGIWNEAYEHDVLQLLLYAHCFLFFGDHRDHKGKWSAGFEESLLYSYRPMTFEAEDISTDSADARGRAIDAASPKTENEMVFRDGLKSELETENSTIVKDVLTKHLSKALRLLGYSSGTHGTSKFLEDGENVLPLRLKPGVGDGNRNEHLAGNGSVICVDDDLERHDSDAEENEDNKDTYASRRNTSYLSNAAKGIQQAIKKPAVPNRATKHVAKDTRAVAVSIPVAGGPTTPHFDKKER